MSLLKPGIFKQHSPQLNFLMKCIFLCFQINFTLIQVVLISGLLFSLVSSLILIPAQRFFVGRAYGIYLFIVYLVFIVIALLVETHVITGDVKGHGG